MRQEPVAPGPGRPLPGAAPDAASDSGPEPSPATRPAPEAGLPIPGVLPPPALPATAETASPAAEPATDRRNGALAFLLLTGAAGFVAGGRLRGSQQGNSSSRFGGLIKQVNSKPEASAGGGGTRPGTGQSSMGTLGLLTGVDPVPQQQPGVGGLPDVIDIVNQGTPAPGTGRTLPSGTDVYTDPRGSGTQWSTPGGQSFSTETTSPRTPPPSSAQQPSVTPQQLTGLEPMPTQQQGPMDLIDVLALTKQGPIKPNTTTELPSGYTIENTTTTTENGVTVSTNTYRYPGADTISRTEYTRTFNEPFNGEGTSYDATVDENGNLTSVTVHGSPTIKKILFNPDHSYTVTGIDGTTQRFDPTGKPIKNLPTELDDPRSQATKDWLKEGWHTATSLNRFIQNLQGAHGVDGLKDDAETLSNAATTYGEWALINKDNPTANAELLTRFGQKLFRYDELIEYGPQYWQQKIGLDLTAAIIGGEAARGAELGVQGLAKGFEEGVPSAATFPKGATTVAPKAEATINAPKPPATLDPSMSNARGPEQATAERLATDPRVSGRTFLSPEGPDPGYDWYDDLGQHYDAMGDGTKAQYVQLEQFMKSIDHHLMKGNDFTVIDMTGFSKVQIQAVEDYIAQLSPSAQEQIIKVGF